MREREREWERQRNGMSVTVSMHMCAHVCVHVGACAYIRACTHIVRPSRQPYYTLTNLLEVNFNFLSRIE